MLRITFMVSLLDKSTSAVTYPRALEPLNGFDRKALVERVRELSPALSCSDEAVSQMRGGRVQAERLLDQLNPAEYGSSRNHLDGAVTRLSPYIRHGVMSVTDVRDRALDISCSKQAEKFIQQLAWREYWHRLYKEFPQNIWQDVEPYKTGFSPEDYQDDLPRDIKEGRTGIACIDSFISELLGSGYVHNHARLYLAGYICHWRRVKWQAGARWFLTHLLDGDPASNNLSWQWAASTFSHKPYYFNLENVEKFSSENVDTRIETNRPLAASYETLYERLFPNLGPKQ
ncbi:MAG: FAD-binding domain-containing protein [Litorimonas sp.]